MKKTLSEQENARNHSQLGISFFPPVALFFFFGPIQVGEARKSNPGERKSLPKQLVGGREQLLLTIVDCLILSLNRMGETRGPIPNLADLKQSSFATTMGSLSHRAQPKDEEGFILSGFGIKKEKNKHKKLLLGKRRAQRRAQPEQGEDAAVRIEVQDDDVESVPYEEDEKQALLRLKFSSDGEELHGHRADESEESDGEGHHHHDDVRSLQLHHQSSSRGLAAELAEYARETKEDLITNLGYMRDSLLTKDGWMLTLKRIKADWRSAGTVALVNLPLSISLAVAADSGPVSGTSPALPPNPQRRTDFLSLTSS